MSFLFGFLKFNIAEFLLMASQGGVSFGHYNIARSLTIPGWIVVIMLPLALIGGVIYLALKILKNPKLK